MAASRRRVTSADVAREAGVSQTTVSYVLNNTSYQRISPETRQRVLAVAERLGYTPSPSARNLRRGRNDVVLLWVKNLPLGPSAVELLERLTDLMEVHGLTVVTRIERERPIAALWRELIPAAIVLFAELSEDDRAEMEAMGVPVVDAWLDDRGPDSVRRSRTQAEVGRLQVRHLAGAGHVRLGYAAPDDARLRALLELRLAGVRQACAGRGLPEPDVREVRPEAGQAAEVIRHWRAAGVTGVCAYNDEVAFALLAGLRLVGLTAPGDLAVIGVDDIPLARLATPPLTTVRQDIRVLAGHLVRQILRALGRPAPEVPASPLAELVVRESA
ncbi:LacI family DNA-binding transcriptional regulator [Bailinhaonella thermotolerans]|uniref:LacI family transcriptional regulator n=1 Tax=Bailinhaonella thermotolerans TaxID=1070861 RepID=A0A3A4B3W9_9ACTN|nr:LacI family DNA-binding transcriptional regulator [Bailinhaonella thermotolerans]RJL35861.1 LacI family transcriptional regulator [Bailinhaonella thermotolerans]